MYDEREETRMRAALGLMMRTVYVLVRWRRKIRPTAYGATALVRVVEFYSESVPGLFRPPPSL
jgi:hypothetical protein